MATVSKRTYTAVCRRVGDWWAVDVPGIRGLHTQARRLDQVEAMTRDAIALLKSVAPSSFDVQVEPLLEGDVEQTVAAATEASERASDRRQCRAADGLATRSVQGLLRSRRVRARYSGGSSLTAA